MLDLCSYSTTLQASFSILRCPVLMNMAQLPEIKPRDSFLKMFLKCFFAGSDDSQNLMGGHMMEKVSAQRSGKLWYGETTENYS